MEDINLFIESVNDYLNKDDNNFEVLLGYLNDVVLKLEDKTVDLTNSVNLYVLGVNLGNRLKSILKVNEDLVTKTMESLKESDLTEEDVIPDDIPF